jgi:hypothetical protein
MVLMQRSSMVGCFFGVPVLMGYGSFNNGFSFGTTLKGGDTKDLLLKQGF